MQSAEYQAAVLKTESRPERINFGVYSIHALLGMIVHVGNVSDVVKKTAFYGRTVNFDALSESLEQIENLASFLRQEIHRGTIDTNTAQMDPNDPSTLSGLDLRALDPRLLHVVLGLNSETGEIAQELADAWEQDRPVDRVNLCEEFGDHFWYLGVGADVLNVPFTTLFQQNITKLQDKKSGRYRRGAFDVDGANVRDLESERGLLEQAVVVTAEPAPYEPPVSRFPEPVARVVVTETNQLRKPGIAEAARGLKDAVLSRFSK